jgi:hypothetical protein
MNGDAARVLSMNSRLRFLADVVMAEAKHLLITDKRLFIVPMTLERAQALGSDIDLAERTDAFVARFGRLQDTLADKLLPALLDALAEPVGTAIDNLNRAERLGWISSVSAWLAARRVRNRMIHEYVADAAELASTLTLAHDTVPILDGAARAMAARVRSMI